MGQSQRKSVQDKASHPPRHQAPGRTRKKRRAPDPPGWGKEADEEAGDAWLRASGGAGEVVTSSKLEGEDDQEAVMTFVKERQQLGGDQVGDSDADSLDLGQPPRESGYHRDYLKEMRGAEGSWREECPSPSSDTHEVTGPQ